jgi:uncharacterized small protein (DUF1192 family)
MLGVTIGQIVGEHIGGRSSEDEQIGLTLPLTHLQVQLALLVDENERISTKQLKVENSVRIANLLFREFTLHFKGSISKSM